MGQRVSRTDFEWVEHRHPHTERREKILKKYPEIKKLFGPDPRFKWEVSACVVTQIIMCFVIKDSSWGIIFLAAYFFGGCINHSLTLAIHEISHNMAFGYAYPAANKMFGIWANFPIGVPMSVAFKKYHVEHHRNQGVDLLDTDVPTKVEAQLFCTTFGKIIWLILQPLFYVIRPVLTYPLPVSTWEIVNIVSQLIFDAIIYMLCGYRAVVYLIGGTIVTMGLHPMAAHFIAEHYMFEKGFETYSYYGTFNWFTFNVGYHNEHHDFPAIPYTRLPEVRRIASEFYDTIPYHTSWWKVLYHFVFDPTIGPYARVKRKQLGLD